jgi:hypothetical protein
MLVVDPKARPSCSEILNLDVVKQKAEKLCINLSDGFQKQQLENDDLADQLSDDQYSDLKNQLLRTIKVPQNLSSLAS